MQSRRTWLWEATLVLGLTGLAAFLRIYRLEALPPGLHGDEAHAGIFAQRVLQEGWLGPYLRVALGQPGGTVYVMALVFKFLGASPFAVRLTTALLGTVAVPLMYLLGRQMFNQRVGLVAAALLALSYWHIHFSRIAHPVVSLPLMEIAALYFLFLGLRSHRAWAFPVGGVFLGLGIYTYHPFPLLLLAVVLVLAYLFFRELRRWSYYLPRLSLFFGVSLLVALPFLAMLLTDGLPDRYGSTSIWHDPIYQRLDGPGQKAVFLAGKAGLSVSSLLHGWGRDWVDGLGERGLLDPVTGALFLGGMALALRRARDERYMLLLLGMGLGLLGGILSTSVEGQYRRVIVVLPFVLLAAGAFTDTLTQLAERRFPGLRRGGAKLLLAVCLALAGYWNVSYYFGSFAPSPAMRWIFVEDLVLATRYLKALEPDTYVYFYSERWSWNYETRRFLLPEMKGEDRSAEFGKLEVARDRPRPVVYLLLPPYDELLPQIQGEYPGGQATELRDEKGRLVYQAYYLNQP